MAEISFDTWLIVFSVLAVVFYSIWSRNVPVSILVTALIAFLSKCIYQLFVWGGMSGDETFCTAMILSILSFCTGIIVVDGTKKEKRLSKPRMVKLDTIA